MSWIKHCIMQPHWYQPISRYSYMLLNVPMIKWCDLHNHTFALGKCHYHAVISVLNDLILCIWIPCTLLPFPRTSLIQENTGNWNYFTFTSSEKPPLLAVSFIRMRKVFSWHCPLNYRQECRDNCEPSSCWLQYHQQERSCFSLCSYFSIPK